MINIIQEKRIKAPFLGSIRVIVINGRRREDCIMLIKKVGNRRENSKNKNAIE